MAINSVPASTQNGLSSAAKLPGDTAAAAAAANGKQTTSAGEAAVFEKSEMPNSSTKTYTRDTLTLSEISKQVESKLSTLRATVENFVAMQGVKTGEAKGLNYDQIMEKYDGKLKEFYQNLEVDEPTRLNAQQEISEEGFWGVKQTSQRAIDFAKALSGGDPSKIALLRKSIEDGYKAAEKSWGGELPEISKLTQEATLKGLDDWAREAGQSA